MKELATAIGLSRVISVLALLLAALAIQSPFV